MGFEKKIDPISHTKGAYVYQTGPFPPPHGDAFYGYFIELTFNFGWEEDMKITSQVLVSPNEFPFPPYKPVPPGPLTSIPPASEPVLKEPDFSGLDLSRVR